jgi:stearoyl-CoA desaturase (Delta-9 desaturase)
LGVHQGVRVLGLARVPGLAPTPKFVRERGVIDADTVRALFTNRMPVLRDYRCRVIWPVFLAVSQQAGAAVLTHRSPQLLVRHTRLLDERSRRQLRELLERYEVLRTVIDFRDRLQLIWDEASAGQARALEQLRELCSQAEDRGIHALRTFALRLRTYAPTAVSTYGAGREKFGWRTRQ